MKERCCENCIYHTYKTPYTSICRIKNIEVLSFEITDCEFYDTQESISSYKSAKTSYNYHKHT